MSADHSKGPNSQEHPVENMSAVNQKPQKEPMPAIPAFSYAQAAKGTSPSQPSSSSASKALSDTTETDTKKTRPSDAGSGTATSARTPTKRTASEGRAPQGKGFERGIEKNDMQPSNSDSTSNDNLKPESSAKDRVSSKAPSKSTSGPSSPDIGGTSASTVTKEEEVFAAGNRSSDSTWDKQSQTSQNGNKSNEKTEVERENASQRAWDEEVPTAAALREAPPPIQNIWQQRKQAQEAKAKSKQSAPLQLSKPPMINNGPVTINGTVKSTETAIDAKKQEGRRKGKSSPDDKASPENAKGVNKEGKARTGEDGIFAHRCTTILTLLTSTSTDKSNTVLMAPPPPPGDEVSWPTPDSAIGEDKKKPQERNEEADKDKEKSQAQKPHGRKGWTPVPYVPTAVFNTPLPQARRGGRPPGASRDSVARGRNYVNTGSGTEKPTSTTSNSATQTPTGGNERGRGAMGPPPTATSTSKPKRASSAGPTALKEQRKIGDMAVLEKQRGNDTSNSRVGQSRRTSVNEARKSTVSTVPSTPQPSRSHGRAQFGESFQVSNQPTGQSSGGEMQPQEMLSDAHSHPRNPGAERKSEGSVRPPDTAKDFHGSVSSRERGEGRPDRGRGGRGRGGGNHAYFNSNLPNGHSFSNGLPYQYQPPPGPQARSFSNHERISSQSQGHFFPAPSQTRNFRSGSRSHSIQHPVPYGRFSNGPNHGSSHLPNIQTDLANQSAYQAVNQGPMTAGPYDSYVEQMSLFRMVTMQMLVLPFPRSHKVIILRHRREYYFSVDNLCKDLFLRKHMDSQGYVSLSVLANFNRIRQLTTDMEMIRYVCLNSPEIEFSTGPDGDRLRTRKGWQQWILNMEERDASAQNEGPVHHPSHDPQTGDGAQTLEDRQANSPRSNTTSNPMDNYQYQSLNGYALPFNYVPAAPLTINGGYSPANQTTYSPGATEFSPSAHSTNRGGSAPDHQTQETNAFTDEQVDNLCILIRKPVNPAAPSFPPFPSLSSRTFSNGSIDGRTLKDELTNTVEPQPVSSSKNGGLERSVCKVYDAIQS